MASTLPPAVSVVIPVHNGECYVAQAIESALGQTLPPRQVIVVDDGSSDRSLQAVQAYAGAVDCVSQPRGGAASARNEGVRRASGAYIAFLDADDLWEPAKLERQLAAVDATGADMVFTHVSEFRDAPGTTEGLRSMPGLIPSTALIRKDAFDAVGCFDTAWRVGEFIDWYMRAVERGLISHVVPEMLVRRRVHGQNMGILERSGQQDYARLLKAALDRRRQTAR